MEESYCDEDFVMVDDENTTSGTCIKNVKYSPKYEDAFLMRYGLFIHWSGPCDGKAGGIAQVNGKQIVNDIDLYAATFNISRIVDDIVELGFEYVIVTDFHGRGTMLHPSLVSDTQRGTGYATKELDVIGDFLRELCSRGIGSILFTHPLDGHDYSSASRTKLGWDDPTENYQRWNDFVNAMYQELIEKYGKYIMGIGFDSEFGLSGNSRFKSKLDIPRLRRTIHDVANDTHQKRLQLYALAGPNECCEFGMKEIWRPSWLDPWRSRKDDSDFNTDYWPAYKRVVAIVQADHWATISAAKKGKAQCNARQLYRYSVLQAASATEGPGVAWAASPYSTGEWEANIREVFAQVALWTRDVRKALRQVYPSTSYPIKEGIQISKLKHGIVATKSMDDLEEYIHVLNPHSVNSNEIDSCNNLKVLKLPPPQDGKLFTSAKLLRTGEAINLTTLMSIDDKEEVDSIELELNEEQEWESHNTIIVLTVDPNSLPSSKNLALHKPVIYSSSEESHFGSIKVNDGIKYVIKPLNEHKKWSAGNYGWKSKQALHFELKPNLALNKQATQSSTLASEDNNWVATNAVNGQLGGRSTTTSRRKNNWWQVDLEVVTIIEKIKVYNRFDGHWDRLKGAIVMILDSEKKAVWKSPEVRQDYAEMLIFDDFLENMEGSYVRIEQKHNILSLGEVEVYGRIQDDMTTLKTDACSLKNQNQELPNLALNKQATQSSTLASRENIWAAASAVNGQHSGRSTATKKNKNNWWQVDLEVVAVIEKIKVYNRFDGYWDRMKGTVVTILNSEKKVVWKSPEVQQDYAEMLIFDNISENVEGSYVRIEQEHNTLCLGEVEVYGRIQDDATTPIANARSLECQNQEKQSLPWVGIDLEDIFHINKIVLYPRNDTNHVGEGFPTQYTIEGSLKYDMTNNEDNNTWFSLARRTEDADNAPGHASTIEIEPSQAARYIRVVGNQLSPYDKQMGLVEIQIFGKGSYVCDLPESSDGDISPMEVDTVR